MQKYRSTMPMLLGLCLVGSTLAATPASAAPGPTGTVFDGDYTATMLVRNGNVYLQYANWRGDVLHYRGTVDASGLADLYHTNGDGSRSILAGQISNDGLTGHVERGEACNYS